MADDPFEYVVAQLQVKSRRGDRVEALCPSHADTQASLSVSRGEEQPVVIHCHAGCSTEMVMAALGMSMADLSASLSPRRVKVYYFQDAGGHALYSEERWAPKTFRPRLPDGSYRRPAPGDEVLYNLPNVLAAKERGERVYLVEGPRDVETLREHGYVGTTAMSGATQPWLPQFSETLANANVTIIADNDKPGRARARRVRDELEPYARTVRAVVPRYGKDVTDLLLAGFGIHLVDPLPASDGALVLHSFDGLEPMPVSWAWDGWIPRGAVVDMQGDPGTGKTSIVSDLCARWTTGASMPDGSPNRFGGPVNVGICSAEDDPARVILPRLLAAGGIPRRVFNIVGVSMVGTDARLLDLSADIEVLMTAIEEHHLKVIVFDPIMAMLGGTKIYIDSEVRKVMSPLRSIAEQYDVLFLNIRHLRKSGGSAIYSGSGSVAFTASARSVLLTARNPHDENERVLAMVKNNLGPLPTSQGYTIVSDAVVGITTSKVSWTGDTPLQASDLLDVGAAASDVRAEVAEECIRLLTIEPHAFLDLKKKLLQAGVECGEKTLRSVLKQVAVREIKDNGTPSAKTIYYLKSQRPGAVPPQDQDQDEPVGTDPNVPSGRDNPQPVGTKDSPESGDSQEALGPLGHGTLKRESAKWSEGSPLGKSENVPSGQPAGTDEVVACVICGTTDSIMYWEDRHEWRCFEHNPLTFQPGDAP